MYEFCYIFSDEAILWTKSNKTKSFYEIMSHAESTNIKGRNKQKSAYLNVCTSIQVFLTGIAIRSKRQNDKTFHAYVSVTYELNQTKRSILIRIRVAPSVFLVREECRMFRLNSMFLYATSERKVRNAVPLSLGNAIHASSIPFPLHTISALTFPALPLPNSQLFTYSKFTLPNL